MEIKKIIFDTDIGGDCDDTGALAIVHQAQNAGKAELLAVTLSTGSPYAAGCADAINRYYGHVVPIGQTLAVPPGDDVTFYPQSYGRHISETFDNSYKPEGGNRPEDAVRLLRRTLADNTGDKITIIVVGCDINIAGLIKSGADDISPLTGMELIKNNVEMLSLMGCFFPTKEVSEVWFGDYNMRAEFNIKVDISAAQTVFKNCPVRIVVSHYLIGRSIHTGGILIKKERKNPVAEAYFVHSHGNRDSWDLVSSYYAVFGRGNIFTDSLRGVITIDDEGVSTFEEKEGGRHVLIDCPDYKKAEREIDDILTGNIPKTLLQN